MLTWIVTNQDGGSELLVHAYEAHDTRRRAAKKLLRDWSGWFDRPLSRKRRLRRKRGFSNRAWVMEQMVRRAENVRNVGA